MIRNFGNDEIFFILFLKGRIKENIASHVLRVFTSISNECLQVVQIYEQKTIVSQHSDGKTRSQPSQHFNVESTLFQRCGSTLK